MHLVGFHYKNPNLSVKYKHLVALSSFFVWEGEGAFSTESCKNESPITSAMSVLPHLPQQELRARFFYDSYWTIVINFSTHPNLMSQSK